MDFLSRKHERDYLAHPTLESLLRYLGDLQQQEGLKLYVNLQDVDDSPIPCMGASCGFQGEPGDAHCDLGKGTRVDLFQRDLLPDGRHTTIAGYNLNADTLRYDLGSSLEEVVDTWATIPQITGTGENSVVEISVVPRATAIEALGINQYDEEEGVYAFKNAYVVTEDAHNMISNIFSKVADHFIAATNSIGPVSASRSNRRRRNRRVQLRNAISGAIYSRLAAYQEFALLRLSRHEIHRAV